jgi:hypothetical protein
MQIVLCIDVQLGYTLGRGQWWLDLRAQLAWWLACCELSSGHLVYQRRLQQPWKTGEPKKPSIPWPAGRCANNGEVVCLVEGEYLVKPWTTAHAVPFLEAVGLISTLIVHTREISCRLHTAGTANTGLP